MLHPRDDHMPMAAAAVETREEPLGELSRHASIPNAFESSSVFDVHKVAGGIELCERLLNQPYRKDYDSIEDPMDWPARFNVSNWTIISAFAAGTHIGGAIGAFDTPGVTMLEGRRDLLVLWDLRVSADARRKGVASALFRAVEAWGRSKHCREIKIETQNTNVAACKFYGRQGCHLTEAKPYVYPGLSGDVQLIWRKAIDG